MRVRFVGSGKTESGERRQSGFLTVGREYVVLSVATDREGVRFLMLDDDAGQPGWYPAKYFDLTSDLVPSNWRIQLGETGSPADIELAPSSWLEPAFWVEYWGDGDVAAIAAQEVFRRELEIILRESST